MASEIHMSEPMCLIENTEAQLVINQEALRILSAITQPVVVVAIVGLYRTGKSYLMNKLAGKRTGECHQQICAWFLLFTHVTSILKADVRKECQREED
jgi:hypothetical protein